MGTSVYPGALDDFAEASPPYLADEDTTGRDHPARHDDLEAAMEAVQGELGTDPAGASATVKARLDALDTTVAGKVASSLVDAKGDLLAATANDTVTRLAVGTNGHVLTADSAESAGVKWAAASSGGLSLIVTETFSAVSSVSVDSVFSADHDNYRVMFTCSASVGGTLLMRLRSSGSDATGSNYSRQLLESYGTTVLASSATATSVYVTWLSTILGFMALDMFSPHLSALTAYSSMGGKPSNSIQVIGHHNLASSYDGLTIYPTSGTITGSLSIYGYES